MKLDIGAYEPVAEAQRHAVNTKAAEALAKRLWEVAMDAQLPYRDVAMALASVGGNLAYQVDDLPSGGFKDLELPATICIWTAMLLAIARAQDAEQQ